MREIVIVCKKAMPLTSSWKERYYGLSFSIEGHEVVPFRRTVYVKEERSESAPLVVPPPRSKCSPLGISYPHTLRKGSQAYDLGPKPKGVGNIYICIDHFNRIPTLEQVLVKYMAVQYTSVTIKDLRTGKTIFPKSDLA